jgi:hypothetical protein
MFDVPEFLIKFEHPCPLLRLWLPPPLADVLLEGGMFDPKFLESERPIFRCGLEVFFQLDWTMV